ncbi:MAG TPA: hypothetical protein VM121_02610 [Acidimicrobiales bacterium]|nr:hypothetical protein [Acidimicrobiales bacterium]
MPVDPEGEPYVALSQLLAQLIDEDVAPLARVHASIAAVSYLEAINRQLVDDAMAQGATWQELADVFVTSIPNVQNRFGSYRNYDDDDELDPED